VLRASKSCELVVNRANSAPLGAVKLGLAKELCSLFAGVKAICDRLIRRLLHCKKNTSVLHRIYENKGVVRALPLDLTKRST
jgi:hypothetical protein